MKALQIKLYQETASYTKPFAYKVGETYPLPPYSTVIGMLHRLLKADAYHEMKVSIQGTYEDKCIDYRSSYLYKGKELGKSPLNIHLLYGVHLLLHIHADEGLLDQIDGQFKQNQEFLSLGRKEDLVRLDEVKWVGIGREDADQHHTLLHDIYVPVYYLQNEDTSGIRYNLNSKYQVINGMRVWEKVPVLYLTEGDHLEEEQYWRDEEGNVVYFHTPL
ncbi:type I-B CRISPR-associated protein Cas5b [Laceyella tengchongensis]